MTATTTATSPSGPRRPALDPADVLELDALLTDEERMIRDVVRRFVGERVLPEVGGWFERGEFPAVSWRRSSARSGLLGMHLDGYGCAGTNAVGYGLACMELEAADSGVRSFMSVQGSLVMFPIWRYGSEEQKQRGCRGWLRAR